jgi:hypothetical protein
VARQLLPHLSLTTPSSPAGSGYALRRVLAGHGHVLRKRSGGCRGQRGRAVSAMSGRSPAPAPALLDCRSQLARGTKLPAGAWVGCNGER